MEKIPIRSLANRARQSLSFTKDFVSALPYAGNKRWYSVCGKGSRKFREFGAPPRKDALCAHCKLLERHRLAWLYFSRLTNLFNGVPKNVLHIAPEGCFEARLRNRLGQGYITADLLDRRVMVRMDITDIKYPDRYFDVIYCGHVLEHVPDDRKALREFHRVLKQDGWAILLVPIAVAKTVEDPSVVDPAERLRLFGQEDHVRRYGADYVERLCEAGFKVKASSASDLFPVREAARMGLTAASGEIYHCSKV